MEGKLTVTPYNLCKWPMKKVKFFATQINGSKLFIVPSLPCTQSSRTIPIHYQTTLNFARIYKSSPTHPTHGKLLPKSQDDEKRGKNKQRNRETHMKSTFRTVPTNNEDKSRGARQLRI
jgi:hypothetical protein